MRENEKQWENLELFLSALHCGISYVGVFVELLKKLSLPTASLDQSSFSAHRKQSKKIKGSAVKTKSALK